MDAARVLKEARRRAGFSQRHLAKLAGVPHSQVARIESGTIVPRVDTLDRLLEVCGVGLEALPRPGIGVDRTMYPEMLNLRPRERLRRAATDAKRMDRYVRAAGRK
jgi:transcriptional regulator with XRE-family HTH domain